MRVVPSSPTAPPPPPELVQPDSTSAVAAAMAAAPRPPLTILVMRALLRAGLTRRSTRVRGRADSGQWSVIVGDDLLADQRPDALARFAEVRIAHGRLDVLR